jgi:hypothetical protein
MRDLRICVSALTLKTLKPEIVRRDVSTVKTENDWLRLGESSSIRRQITTFPARRRRARRRTTQP